MLVLGADGDLGQPAVLAVDRVADQLELGPEDVLVEGEAVAEPELAAGVAGVEFLVRVGNLEPVVKSDRGAEIAQLIVGQADIGDIGLGPDPIAGLVAGDDRPGRQPAAGRALDGADPVGQEQLAALAQFVGRRARCASQEGGGDQGREKAWQAGCHGRLWRRSDSMHG